MSTLTLILSVFFSMFLVIILDLKGSFLEGGIGGKWWAGPDKREVGVWTFSCVLLMVEVSLERVEEEEGEVEEKFGLSVPDIACIDWAWGATLNGMKLWQAKRRAEMSRWRGRGGVLDDFNFGSNPNRSLICIHSPVLVFSLPHLLTLSQRTLPPPPHTSSPSSPSHPLHTTSPPSSYSNLRGSIDLSRWNRLGIIRDTDS